MPSDFSVLLQRLLIDRRLSGRAFCRIIGRSSGFLTDVLKGRSAPADDVVAWADALELTGNERTEFLVAAGWVRTPDSVKDYAAALEARVQKLELEEIVGRKSKRKA